MLLLSSLLFQVLPGNNNDVSENNKIFSFSQRVSDRLSQPSDITANNIHIHASTHQPPEGTSNDISLQHECNSGKNNNGFKEGKQEDTV